MALGVVPTVTSETCEATSSGSIACETAQVSLLEGEGAGIVILLAVPVLVVATPVIFPRRWTTIAAAVVLTAMSMIAIASVGLFFVPTAALAWMAVAATPRSRDLVSARDLS